MAEPSITAGDLDVIEHTGAIVEASSFDCTIDVAQIATVVQPMVAAATVVYTVVEHLPYEAASTTVVQHEDILPSQSMYHMFSHAADHMHDSLCLHVPPIYKRNNIGWMFLTLSSTCNYTLRVGAHKLDIWDTMVHCHKLMVSALLKLDNFRNWGSYLWCVRLHETECNKYHHDPLSPS